MKLSNLSKSMFFFHAPELFKWVNNYFAPLFLCSILVVYLATQVNTLRLLESGMIKAVIQIMKSIPVIG